MQSSVFVGVAITLLLFACGSSDGPSASDAGATGSSSSDGGSHSSDGGTSTGGKPDSDAGSGGGSSGYGCALLTQSCDCQDPPPQGYTANSCPAYACCFTASGSFLDCTCLDEQDPQCSQQIAGKDVTRVDHCPP